MAQNEYYLMHHGVKGMKWGVRKTPEQLGYRSSGGRTPSVKTRVGKSTKVARRFAQSSSSKIKDKFSDPEFQRKVATGAKVALAIGAVYATHKLVNSPQTLEVGKNLIGGVLGKTGTMKASMLNSTEFKVAKAGLGLAKKGVQKLGSSEVRSTISGIGALAGTVGILKNQLKGLREDQVDGDTIDKAVTYTKKISEIGESINTIAQGPKGAASSSSTSSSSSNSSNSTSNSQKEHTATLKGGVTVKTTRHMGSEEWGNVRRYVQAHKGMTTKEAMDELGYLHPDEVRHSGSKANTSGSTSSRPGNIMRDSSTGRTVRTNKPLTIKDSKEISDYQKSHPNKSLEDALDDLGLLDKDYARHSAIRHGWSFNRSAGCRYIF